MFAKAPKTHYLCTGFAQKWRADLDHIINPKTPNIMRRIEFLAPVEAMRGNLSGSQRLTYPTQNNSAWDSPSDKRNYSTNYNTRYIGNKRTINGKKFFSVKTKTAVTMSPKMREQQAVLSVGSVIANIIMADLRTLVRLQELFKISPEISQGWSFKRWISVYTREGLKTKRHIVFPTTGSAAAIIFVNPYISTAAPSQSYELVTFPVDILVKFWGQLADNPVTFTISGLKGIAHDGETWAALIASNHNNLELAVDSTYVKLGDLWVKYPIGDDDYEYVTSTQPVPIEYQGQKIYEYSTSTSSPS